VRSEVAMLSGNRLLPLPDTSCRESFEHVEKWLDDLAKHLDVSAVTKVIVGNKSDLHSKRVVQYDEGLALAQKLNLECVIMHGSWHIVAVFDS
jgi:hypothetical protein